ncbi:MAG: Lrp/AsnC family transcriptional regulator, partial [Rhodocyclaceae bacterium]
MDSPYSPLEFALLNGWQRDFPIVAQPFRQIGAGVGAGDTATLATPGRLPARGAIWRVGAVFAHGSY